MLQMIRMGWKGVEDPLDSRLLLVSFFGTLMVDLFTIISNLAVYDQYEMIARIILIKTVFSMIQSVIQASYWYFW